MNKSYEDMLNETQRRVKEQSADSEKVLRELRTKIQEANEANDTHQAELVKLFFCRADAS